MTNRFVPIVQTAARNLGLLDEQGNLLVLDSLGVIDLVVELERLTAVSIPFEITSDETFASVAATAAMLERLGAAPPA